MQQCQHQVRNWAALQEAWLLLVAFQDQAPACHLASYVHSTQGVCVHHRRLCTPLPETLPLGLNPTSLVIAPAVP